MNILIVLPFLKAGGTERQASYIANHLQRKGHNVTVLSIEKSDGAFRPLFDCSVKSLNSKNSPSRIILNVILFLNFLRKNNYDVLISRAWNSNMICSFVSFVTRIPSILFLSGSIDLSGHSFFKRMIHRFVLRKATKIISVSEAAKKNCIKWLDIPEVKIKVVHNGIDIKSVEKQADQKFEISEDFNDERRSIVFVGTLIHRKGVDILLKAFSQLLKFEDLNLIIVGDGALRDYYRQLSKKLNSTSHVYFVGEKVNPFPYIKLGDVFILPSRSEGFPNVLLEAMALKKPVIATNCPTGPNEVLNNKNGFLIPVDDIEEIVEKVELYFKNPSLRNEHAKLAYETAVDKFALQNQMDKIVNEIKKI